MKMDIFFGNLFWGILIILIGISLVLKGFNVSIPLVKTFVAIVIIMFGIKILVGGYSRGKTHGINTNSMSGTTQEFTSVFSGSFYDFNNLDPKATEAEVSVVFGSARVKLPRDIEFDIESNAVFGSVILPQKTSAGIASGDALLNANAKRRVKIEANSVFGRLEFYLDPDQPVPVDSSKATGDSTAF